MVRSPHGSLYPELDRLYAATLKQIHLRENEIDALQAIDPHMQTVGDYLTRFPYTSHQGMMHNPSRMMLIEQGMPPALAKEVDNIITRLVEQTAGERSFLYVPEEERKIKI